MQFDNLLLEQTQAPSGKAYRDRRERQRDQFCFRRAVENPPPGGVRVVFAGQHRLEPFLDQLVPGPLDSGDAGVQRRGDPAVAPAFARIRYVRLQQDARLRQQLGGTLAFANQLVESIAFLHVEPDHVFLDGDLFPGHESPPSLPCCDRDSEIPVMINDGGDYSDSVDLGQARGPVQSIFSQEDGCAGAADKFTQSAQAWLRSRRRMWARCRSSRFASTPYRKPSPTCSR